MIGLTLVVLVLLMAIFADFVAPDDPLRPDQSFSPPDAISFFDADGNFSIFPRVYAQVESDKLDPVTFQPLNMARITNIRIMSACSFTALTTPYSGLFQATVICSARSTARRSTSSAPTSLAATSFRAGSSARASP